MKTLCKVLVLPAFLAVMLLAMPAFALTDYGFVSVNGDTTATTATQGDLVGWGANCETGASMLWEIWGDINLDSVIDEGSDFMLVSYVAADGQVIVDGPPADTTPADGWFITAPLVLGLAPCNYILRATDLSDMSSVEKSIIFEALSSPTNPISGTVSIEGITPPDNMLQKIWVQAETDSLGFQLWSAFTDNTGAYTINLGAAGTGLYFEVYPYPISGFVTPTSQYVLGDGPTGSIDFHYGAPADSVYGYILDPDDNPIYPASVWCQPVGGGPEKYFESYDGYYVIYFSDSELGEWWLGVSDDLSTDYMVPQSFMFDNSVVHSFEHNLVCVVADTVIDFTITEDGGNPAHQYRVYAYSNDLQSYAYAVSSIGDVGPYQLHVSSDDVSGYMVAVSLWDENYPIPDGYTVVGNGNGVAPGDTVEFSVIQGKEVCDQVVFDPGDPTVPWDNVDVRLNGANGNYSVHPIAGGNYYLYADTGTYNLTAYAVNYLSTPGVYALQLTNDTCGGLGFTLNEQHEHIAGQIVGVTLPLTGTYWVTAGTDDFPDGYHTSSEQVVNATGEFHIYVCDGQWTFNPPFIPGYPQPVPQMITVSENRDTTITLIFDYSNLVTLSDTLGLDPDDPVPNPDSVTVWATTGMQNYSDHPDVDGRYSMEIEPGWGYDIYVVSPGYLASPAMHSVFINSDQVDNGLGFTLNKQHCLITGNIQGVSLPLVADHYVLGGTAEFPEGYHIGSNAVDHATGLYGFYVCDGIWTIYPPDIPGYVTPDSVELTIGEDPDNSRTVNFVYEVESDAPDGHEPLLPNEYTLNQNHPNPFNASTSISFALPARADIRIEVYNILGQPVAVLAEGDYSAGSYSVSWDGTTAAGIPVSSGIYFYRLSAGINSIVKKMVVLK